MKQDNKALIERAFEKWWYLKYKDLMIEYDYIKDLGERKLKVNYWHSYCRQAFIAGATWQREQLEAEIREAFTDGCRQGHDEASESIFNAETRVREQLIQEIKPLIYKAYCEYGCSGVTSKPNNSCDAGEMKSCGGCYTWKTYQSILAKLDLLEKGCE